MKKYSPPRSTLNVSMPWTRRLTGASGIVKLAPSSCSPMTGSRSFPISMKLPSLIHSCCRNSMVAHRLGADEQKDGAAQHLAFFFEKAHSDRTVFHMLCRAL
jgi:hypothetical protein